MFTRIPLFAAFILALFPEMARAIPAVSVAYIPPVTLEGQPDTPGEPPAGATIVIMLTLSEPAPAGCSFKFTERPGSAARLGVDYEIRPADQSTITMAPDGRLSFIGGLQSGLLTLRCIGNFTGEPDKILLGSLTDPVNCTIPSPNWSTVIEDDDRALFVAVRPLTPARIEIVIFTDNFRIVRTFTRDGQYGAAPSVAFGDVFDGDGVPEVIVGSDAGVVTRFYVYRWWGPVLGDTVEYFPYGPTDLSGCYVAAGDCGGYSSADDVAVGPRNRTPVTLQAWSVNLAPAGSSVVGNQLQMRNEIVAAFNIGGHALVPAMGELNGDGRGDLLTGDGPTTVFACGVSGYHGGYGHSYPLEYVQGFSFYPYPGNKDGLSVSAGDWNGDGITEVVTGAGPNSGSHVLMYDPKKKEAVFGAFVTPESQGRLGGARVAMQPRRHYSPSGGMRTLLLADAISVSHSGVLYSSDGTPPITPSGGLLDAPGTAIAAWTPAQEQPGRRVDLHVQSVRTDVSSPVPYTVIKMQATGIPLQTRWQIQNSLDLQSWGNTNYFISRTSPAGSDFIDVVVGGFPPKHFWRLRQVGVSP